LNCLSYIRTNGILRRNFGKQLRKKIVLRFHNVVGMPKHCYMAVNAGLVAKKRKDLFSLHK
jgi:hypothetical protein